LLFRLPTEVPLHIFSCVMANHVFHQVHYNFSSDGRRLPTLEHIDCSLEGDDCITMHPIHPC
jgi:hypothetical protein